MERIKQKIRNTQEASVEGAFIAETSAAEPPAAGAVTGGAWITDTSVRELLLIRHGATAGNLERRYIGRTDEPLCSAGIAQAEALRHTLPAEDWEAAALFASPMLRARQTAALLFPGKAYTAVPELRETDFGEFEGKTAGELSEHAAYRSWVEGGCTGPIPGGEAVADFRTRCVRGFLDTLTRCPPAERAVFVLHGGGIMAILAALSRPIRGFYDFYVPNCGVVCCRVAEGFLQIRS